MRPRLRQSMMRIRKALPAVGLAAALVVASSTAALAAKWTECPSPQVRAYRSARGAVTSQFAHPGHEIGILLSSHEIKARGGFSTEPDGNSIAISLASVFGEPIVLLEVTTAAVSPATLYFTFPDAEAILGRTAAGPVEIRVTRVVS